MKSGRKYDLLIALALLLLPLLWFWPQTFGGRTLLPADNLYQYQPWQSYADQFGVRVPYNPLISDLVLENLPWKTFIVEQLRAGRPADLLWNPRSFAGVPFLAAGQHSALYPFSLIFYVLPLWQAFGVFTALQLGLAAMGMFIFARVLSQRRAGAAIAAVAYAFSGFYIVSVNFTMMIAAAAWLPLILAMIEIIIRKQEQKGATPYSPVPYVIAERALSEHPDTRRPRRDHLLRPVGQCHVRRLAPDRRMAKAGLLAAAASARGLARGHDRSGAGAECHPAHSAL